MRAVVFAGPSLPRDAAPPIPGLEWRPPVRQGDVYRAALSRPDIIAIVDGYFEVTPTVWHKEILWAMAQGIHVYGSASIGALRAAELDVFGMKGVGRIYGMYRDGLLQDDDEVAVLHGPEELGYPQLSEAMVNIRATLQKATRVGILRRSDAGALALAAKSLFYKFRTYDATFAAALPTVAEAVLRNFASWLPQGRLDQKHLDAAAMLLAVSRHLTQGGEPLTPSFTFAPTLFWESAAERASSGPDQRNTDLPT